MRCRKRCSRDGKDKPLGNDTHAGTTDPDARLYRKSDNTASVLAYQGHGLMENRSGLVVSAVVTQADGSGERQAAPTMLDAMPARPTRTLGADSAYDTRDCVATCRARGMTPHLARNDDGRRSAIDERVTRHEGDTRSEVVGKRIEEHFGWGKTVGRVRQTVYRGIERVDQHFKLKMRASNLIRHGPHCQVRT